MPGVIYGGDDELRALRGRRAASCATRWRTRGAVLEISLDGGGATPVLVKDVQRHPVRGEVVHVDLLRVRMDQPIHDDGRRSS